MYVYMKKKKKTVPCRLPQPWESCSCSEPRGPPLLSPAPPLLRPQSRESWWMQVLCLWFEGLFFFFLSFSLIHTHTT